MPSGKSKADILRENPDKAKRFWKSLSKEEARVLLGQWHDFWARPKQLPPPDDAVEDPLGWKFWCYLAGRGTGKTRLAAEFVLSEILAGRAKRIVFAAPTYAQIHKVMLKGESGLYEVFRNRAPHLKLKKSQSNTVLVLQGKTEVASISLLSGEEPEKFRGEQCDLTWFDELAAFRYLQECFELWLPQLRLGKNPRAIFTTTPKPSLLTVDLLQNERTVVTFAHSSENKGNLPPGYLETLEDIYGDTDFGAQELAGALFLSQSGSFFKPNWLNEHRVKDAKIVQEGGKYCIKSPNGTISLSKMIVAVDPSGSAKDSACECGIIVAGLSHDNVGYVLEDLSMRGTPDQWGTKVVDACIKYNATAVYEANFGGGMGGDLLRRIAQTLGKTITVRDKTAQKDKAQRAMIASPYVQKGKMRLAGTFKKLEEQLVLWEPKEGAKSPDRLDAFVWATLDLMQQTPRGTIGTNLGLF